MKTAADTAAAAATKIRNAQLRVLRQLPTEAKYLSSVEAGQLRDMERAGHIEYVDGKWRGTATWPALWEALIAQQPPKICKRGCTTAPWTCRECERKFCEHYVGWKDTDFSATCTACETKRGEGAPRRRGSK